VAHLVRCRLEPSAQCLARDAGISSPSLHRRASLSASLVSGCRSSAALVSRSRAAHNRAPGSWAVRHENGPTIPIDVLDADLIKLFFVPHAGVTYENDDIAEKLENRRPPIGLKRSEDSWLGLYFVATSARRCLCSDACIAAMQKAHERRWWKDKKGSQLYKQRTRIDACPQELCLMAPGDSVLERYQYWASNSFLRRYGPNRLRQDRWICLYPHEFQVRVCSIRLVAVRVRMRSCFL